MPHKIERVEDIKNVENQRVPQVISNALNEMNTIANSLNSTNNSAGIESDDEIFDDFILYGLLQSQRYYKNRIHKRPDSSCMANDILTMPPEMF
jgi:hypothetical protein